MPDWQDFRLKSISALINGEEYREENSRLIEEAFYNQRYIIDAEGAVVDITGADSIRRIRLQVRPLSDNGLVDILAKVTTDGGEFLMKNRACIWCIVRFPTPMPAALCCRIRRLIWYRWVKMERFISSGIWQQLISV